MEFLQLCLIYSIPHEDEVRRKVARMIEEVTADVRAGNIPFTEENLITIQDVFGMTVKAKYDVEIIKKSKCLLANFYEEVRRVDNKERMMQEQAEEDRSDMSTQFPENEEVRNTLATKLKNIFLIVIV